MSEEDCLGARFEILVDGKTQYCRDTMVTAMGAANIIRGQNPKSRVAVRDLQTGQLIVIPAMQPFDPDDSSGQIPRQAHWRSA
jgi:hypothetical protein